MELKLDKDMVSDIVQAAVMDMLKPEQRDALVTQAIQSLLSHDVDRNGRRDTKSNLQQAFEDTAIAIARRYVEEKLTADETFTKALDELFAAALKRFYEDNTGREKIIQSISDGMRKAITGDRY